MDVEAFKTAVTGASNNILNEESNITEYDTIVGDGDCGVTLSRAAKAILKSLDNVSVSDDAVSTMTSLAEVLEENMDGTSGALYSLFFNAFAACLQESGPFYEDLSIDVLAKAGMGALDALEKMTAARVGDRTLMDALRPYLETLANSLLPSAAVKAAERGMKSTIGMKPAFGRAVYVEESGWDKVPDPGAVGVVCIARGLAGLTS